MVVGVRSQPIQAVLFDFDGTLWDPERSIFEVYSEELREVGFILDSTLWQSVIGANETDLWSELERVFGKAVCQVVRARIHARQEHVLSAVPTRPGVASLLAAIDSAGIPRGIVSNSSDDWVGHYSKQCGIAHGWTTVECANGNPSRAKPKPDLYSEAVRRIGVDPSAVIAFEDSPRGVEAARRAGVVCIAVPNEMTAHLDLSRADFRFESFELVNQARLFSA